MFGRSYIKEWFNWSMQWPCQQILFFIRTHTDLHVRFSYLLDRYLYTGLTTVSVFMILTTSTRGVRPVGRRWPILLGALSHLYLFRGPYRFALNQIFFKWLTVSYYHIWFHKKEYFCFFFFLSEIHFLIKKKTTTKKRWSNLLCSNFLLVCTENNSWGCQ